MGGCCGIIELVLQTAETVRGGGVSLGLNNESNVYGDREEKSEETKRSQMNEETREKIAKMMGKWRGNGRERSPEVDEYTASVCVRVCGV